MKPSERRRREREAREADEATDAKSVESLLAWAGAKSEYELHTNLVALKATALNKAGML